MISWLLALLASAQVPYVLLALVLFMGRYLFSVSNEKILKLEKALKLLLCGSVIVL